MVLDVDYHRASQNWVAILVSMVAHVLSMVALLLAILAHALLDIVDSPVKILPVLQIHVLMKEFAV